MDKIMELLKNRKQATLDTTLLMFMLALLVSHGEELSKRGEWMKSINQHVIKQVDAVKEIKIRLAKLEKEM